MKPAKIKISKDCNLFKWQRSVIGEEEECPRCHKTRKMTVDHIIPRQFLEWLGLTDEILNDEENFELVCEGCNKWKSNRIDITNPKTKELLLKYINLI